MPTGSPGETTGLVPWFGAKRTLGPIIVRHLGPHRAYWELFCGSCAVLFAKDQATMETVNDLHGDLINLARVIRDEELAPRLYWRLRRTLPAEKLFREAQAIIRTDPPPAEPSVDRAGHYLYASWIGLSGVAGTPNKNTSFARRFSSKGGNVAVRFLNAVESLPWWHERLRGVTVLNGCGLELAEKIEDREGTVIYADPPYLVKGAKYVHDFTPADHERLAAALCRLKATRVVVSYYAHPELERLYPGWTVVNIATAKALVLCGHRPEGRVEAPEVLLINGPADPAAAPASMFDQVEGE
jgi:DNA adenine methylase